MAININLGPRQDVETFNQPIPRTFVGFEPKASDEELWNANRGAWELPEQANQEQFATFSFDGTIRLVAELEGIENVEQDGKPVRALLGRLLHPGDPVRDALVGQGVEDTESDFAFFETTELDEMSAAERYAPSERKRRTFLINHNADQWFWSPADEQEVVARTAAGAPVRECWGAGGRRHGIEPGDRIFLLERNAKGPLGVRGRGTVSSRIYQGEHWDDPSRNANYIDIDWDLVVSSERVVPVEQLRSEIPGYAWNPQKSGVELHQPMAEQMEQLWARHFGDDATEHVEPEVGWDFDDARRRVLNTEARARIVANYENDGWEVAQTNDDRPFCAVAFRGEEQLYLFAKGAETVGRPVLLSADEVAHIVAHPDDCVLGVLSDVSFEQGQVADDGEYGIFTVIPLKPKEEEFVPVLYRYEVVSR